MPRDCGELMEPIKQHFRITYKKGEALRYTANLDVHKIWERYFRRVRIHLAYSKGFHPQPRINQALPLPLGMLSDFELLEFWTESAESQNLDRIQSLFDTIKQPGIEIFNFEEIEAKQKSLQSLVQSVKYTAKQFYDDGNQNDPTSITDLLGQESIIRVRRKKEYDLKPLILELTVKNETDGILYSMHLIALPGQSGRPDEVLLALGHDPNHFRIVRTQIILSE